MPAESSRALSNADNVARLADQKCTTPDILLIILIARAFTTDVNLSVNHVNLSFLASALPDWRGANHPQSFYVAGGIRTCFLRVRFY
jgi:hypothetical protein